jgi:DNA-binding response OmpR family regulator
MSEEVLLEKKEEKPAEETAEDKAPVEEAKVGEKREAVEEEKEVEEEPVGEEEIKKRIIIVDSQEKSLDGAISALRKGDYNVIGVESTEEFFEITQRVYSKTEESEIKTVSPEAFWELMKGDAPDLLITDLDLKDLDGWEFVMLLKFDNRYYEFREVPIIVWTDAPITVETVKKVQSESIYDYIPKSVKGKELLKKIDNFFETREKLAERKKEIAKVLSYVVANEYERISLAIRVRLKYLHALKTSLEALKKEEGDPGEIKKIQETYYLKNRELIKHERRRREIKHLLKDKKQDNKEETSSEDDDSNTKRKN